MRLVSFLPAAVLVLASIGSAISACGGSNQVLGKTGSGSAGSGVGGGTGASGTSSAQGGAGHGGGINFGDGGPDGGVNSNYPCSGCPTFPSTNAPTCPASTLGPPTLAYPLDGILLPPNMNVLEVQFTPPAGATLFEVDFENAITSVKVETMCNPVTPVRGGASPGCGVTLPQAAWNDIANTNRDGDPVKVTLRATANGSCVSTSTASVAINFAKDDLAGGIYYWQAATYGGVGGKTGGIYSRDFGTFDPTPTPFYTSGASGTCVGCHYLSRDGARISLAFDDPDGDDEFGDEHTSVLDVATRTALGGMQVSPGFQTWTHDHSKMIASTFKNGMGPMMMTGGGDKTFAVFNNSGMTPLGSLSLPMPGTQPDLSKDDTTLLFVVPVVGPAACDIAPFSMQGDHHFVGGSLWSATFDTTNNTLTGAKEILQASGHNYYYPNLSPDQTFIVFNDAPQPGNTTMTNNDAFYNRSARVKLLHFPSAAGATPLDLPALNVGDGLTNSWPRWSPFVQTYKGHKLLWVTFSSNRDYGLHLTNKGFDNCYPPEGPTCNQPQPLSKMGVGYQNCAQPQIWMAGVIVDPDPTLDAKDRSFPAFWLPFQDVTAHNHSAQWVEQIQGAPGPDGGTGTDGGGDGGGTCGESGVTCGGSAVLCCPDMVCCNGICLPACAQ
jgi:hypothetical protein